MRKFIICLMLSVFTFSVFTGCGSTEDAGNTESEAEETTGEASSVEADDSQFTLASVNWGSSISEFEADYPELEYTVTESSISHITTDGLTFYGIQVSADFVFYSYNDYNGSDDMLLGGLYITTDSDEDLSSISDAITADLGEKETTGYTAGGSSYELSTSAMYWHSEQSVLETGGEDFRQYLLSMGFGETNSMSLTAEEYTDYILEYSYPVKITIEGDRFYIDGDWAAVLAIYE